MGHTVCVGDKVGIHEFVKNAAIRFDVILFVFVRRFLNQVKSLLKISLWLDIIRHHSTSYYAFSTGSHVLSLSSPRANALAPPSPHFIQYIYIILTVLTSRIRP
jgi:hypothetical protein